MVTSTARGGRAPGRALKSPLAAPGASAVCSAANFGSLAPAPGQAALTDREATLAEFQGYLRTVNNRAGRPFEEKTITVYSDPVKSLDRWMTANGVSGDFDVVDTALLNRARAGRTRSSATSSSCSTSWIASAATRARTRTGSTGTRQSRGGPRPCPASSSMTCSRSPGAGGRGTSRRRAITRSSASCAARASGGWNCSAWSCTRSRPT
jgi:hypothetical protein